MAELAPGRPGMPPDLLGALVPVHAPAGQLVVMVEGETLVDTAAGLLFDDTGEATTTKTRFDLASLTKLFTAVAFMSLVEAGCVRLDDRVNQVLPGFGAGAPAAASVTWRHLLSHASGLPATIPLQAAASPEEARRIVLSIPPTAPPGTTVQYSDLGFIVLGIGLEVLTGMGLADVVQERVLSPAGLHDTGFLPDRSLPVAPTEVCPWRQRRLHREVHDENAASLGGVAGHAGLFGTASDLATMAGILLAGGGRVLRPASVAEMTREAAVGAGMRRGLGFSLWSPDPDATSNPFGKRAFGHTGFTGTSLWADPDRELVVALLTNVVYRGREDRGFSAARIELHRTIVGAVDALATDVAEAS